MMRHMATPVLPTPPPLSRSREWILGNIIMDYTASLQCGWVAIHVIGLVAACLLRVYAETAAETPLQLLYLLGLAGVGVATLAGQQFTWSPWTLSAATMSLMIVVGVADFRSPQHEQIG